MSNDKTNKIIDKIKVTPQLSPTTALLLAKIGDKEHSLNDIKTIVETDTVLTSLALKTVNSAAYGLLREIDTIEEALKYLGDTVIASLALKKEKIFDANLSGYIAEDVEIWRHSLRTAVGARYIAEKFSDGKVQGSIAYTAGIVHDLGKTVISSFLEESDFHGVLPDNFELAEKEKLGISHSEAGYYLSKQWKLPNSLSEVIRFHHRPSDCSEEFKLLAYVVHLADITAMINGDGTGIDTLRHPLDQNYKEYLNINKAQLELAIIEIEEEFSSSYKSIKTAFNI